MLNSTEIAEKKFSEETQRVIGEVQLHQYGNFLEKHHHKLKLIENQLSAYDKKDSNIRPINVQIAAREDITVLDLVHSDNKLLSKILTSLVSVCVEIKTLVNEAKEEYFIQLVYYGEHDKNETNFQQLGKLFELLQKVSLFVARCIQVIQLTLQQICALSGKKFTKGSSTVFPELFGCLSELLAVLVTLDLLLNSTIIKEHWMVYRKAVKGMSHNPKAFNVEREGLRALDKKLIEVETQLLGGNLFQIVLEKCLNEDTLLAVKSCNIANEMYLYIQQVLVDLEKDDETLRFKEMWLQSHALFAMYFKLHGSTDKKFLRRLTEINKRIIHCLVSGNILWYPEEFLLKNTGTYNKFVDTKAIIAHRKQQLNQKLQSLPKDVNILCLQSCYWIIQIEHVAQEDMSCYKIKQLQDAGNLLADGLKLCQKISSLIQWITNLHAMEGRSMQKSILLSLCKLVEVLKCFESVIRKNVMPLTYVIQLIQQHLTHKAIATIVSIKKSFTQGKHYKEQQLDVLFALVEAERALRGPNTNQRILLAKLSLTASGVDNETLQPIRAVIYEIELINHILDTFKSLCNCSFLYWHQVLFPIYFSKIADAKTDVAQCYLILSALSDCTNHGANVAANVEHYLKSNLIDSLSQTIESNLRLQTHLHLQLPDLNPFTTPLPYSYRKLMPILFNDTFINIKQEIEHYLSTMFYNLTTVVLHDWKTYGEMRHLAALQYGLHAVESNLPLQTLEQGIDVLEIMRNINTFVTKYLYNLNSQVFIEEWSSNNKQLNTINTSHVANSIRTHGIGIMSTTVNFTYQFLQKKFFAFSQFMFDEHIKSRLLKDTRYFAEVRDEVNQLYPFARAEKFNYGIKRLGTKEGSMTHLDLFRKLITQIGNAMGYVRLVRSGGKRCVSEATRFIPDFKGIHEIIKELDENILSELSGKAAKAFKRDLNNLVDSFEEATEYFTLLVNVFAPSFRDAQNVHLRNFYIIIPPLTINFVEHIMNLKESLFKKNRRGAFTDDGFAMGLAYIVELLDQGTNFDSLHWFQSVQYKYEQDFKDLERQKLQSSRDDVKLQQTLTLTEKRIKSFQTEFQLLYYNFNSARVFFQT